MNAIVDTPEQAAGLSLPPLLVRRPLERYLDGLGLGEGELAAEQIGEGHSNVTYLVRREGAEVVLRRPPRPPLPPSAHDVLREAWLLRSLEPTAVRVPRVLGACDDDSVIGAPFYLMEYLEGHVITGQVPERLADESEHRRISEELIDSLVEIHAVDWQAVGLEGYGKPTGYLERQLRRFGGLWEHNKTREIPTLDRVTEWLSGNLPDSGAATIVHGDYRLGNTMFAPAEPARLIAVFDWELSTIGDPLADVGYMLATWGQQGDPENAITALGGVTRSPGFLTRDELVARYEELSGRSMGDVRWYMTLALWKSAVFLEGSYKRRLAGTTEDAFFDLLEQGVPEIAERAWEIAAG